MPNLSVTTNKNRSKSRVYRTDGPQTRTRGAKKYPTKKQEKKQAQRRSKRDMMKAMKSLDEYESHAPFETTDTVKDATRSMMNIVEDVSEKGKMTDNQYLEMMNHLLKIHKSEDTPTIGRRIPRWSDRPGGPYQRVQVQLPSVEHSFRPRSEYVRITADAEAARERAHLANRELAASRAHLAALRSVRSERAASYHVYEELHRAISYSDNIL
jgi:hypothetical protein